MFYINIHTYDIPFKVSWKKIMKQIFRMRNIFILLVQFHVQTFIKIIAHITLKLKQILKNKTFFAYIIINCNNMNFCSKNTWKCSSKTTMCIHTIHYLHAPQVVCHLFFSTICCLFTQIK